MHNHDIIQPGFALFWNNISTVGTGVWNDYPQVKAVRWREGYRYRDHNCPCDADGKPVTAIVKPHRTAEQLYAHYSWVKPIEKLRQKAAYYEQQPGARERIRPNYIDTVFLPWRERQKEIVERFGTHPFGNGGAERFTGVHPEPIARRIVAGEFKWD